MNRKFRLNGKQWSCCVLCACILLLVGASYVWASGEGGHGAGQMKDFLYRCLDFVITFGVLGYLLFGPVKRGLMARRERIADSLEKARQMKADAESAHAECQRQLASAGKDIEKLRASLREESEQERTKIWAQARQLAESLQNDATLAAAREIAQARRQLHDEAVQLAIQMAEEILKQELTAKDHSRLVDEFLCQEGVGSEKYHHIKKIRKSFSSTCVTR